MLRKLRPGKIRCEFAKKIDICMIWPEATCKETGRLLLFLGIGRLYEELPEV